MNNLLQIRINKNFSPYRSGMVIKVNHKNGIPLDKYWRDRIKDSVIDGCVTIIQSVENKKPAKDKVQKEV